MEPFLTLFPAVTRRALGEQGPVTHTETLWGRYY